MALIIFKYYVLLSKAWWHFIEWVHTSNVTAYRNTVSWQCGRDSCPRNVSKVDYAVTLEVCTHSMKCHHALDKST